MKKKASKISKFPNIYRIFTEIPRKIAILTFVALILSIIAIALESYVLYKNLKQYQQLRLERLDLVGKVKEWETIVEKYKDYRDGYFYLASLEYSLGNFDKSRFYIEKTLQIDPNFDKGRELEKLLKN